MAQGFTNQGAIELTQINGSSRLSPRWRSAAAPWSTPPAAASQRWPAPAARRSLNAQLDNQGTLTIDRDLTLEQGPADHVNSGTINVTGGDLTVTQSGATPLLHQHRHITVGGGRTFTVSGGAFNHNGGQLGGAGHALPQLRCTATSHADQRGCLALMASMVELRPRPDHGRHDPVADHLDLHLARDADQRGRQDADAEGSTINAAVVNEGPLLAEGRSAPSTARSRRRPAPRSRTVRPRHADGGQRLQQPGGHRAGQPREAGLPTLTVTSGTLTNAAGAAIRALTGGSRTLRRSWTTAAPCSCPQPDHQQGLGRPRQQRHHRRHRRRPDRQPVRHHARPSPIPASSTWPPTVR